MEIHEKARELLRQAVAKNLPPNIIAPTSNKEEK